MFDDMKQNEPDRFNELPCFEEKIKDHGRIETRKYIVFDDPEDIRHVIPESWDKVKCVGMAILVRGKGDKKSTEIHFHVMSKAVGAEEYGSLARGHWAILSEAFCYPKLLPGRLEIPKVILMKASDNSNPILNCVLSDKATIFL